MRDFRPPSEDPYAGPPSDPFRMRATQISTSPFPPTEKRALRAGSPLRASGGYVPPYSNTMYQPSPHIKEMMMPSPVRPMSINPRADDMLAQIETL